MTRAERNALAAMPLTLAHRPATRSRTVGTDPSLRVMTPAKPGHNGDSTLHRKNRRSGKRGQDRYWSGSMYPNFRDGGDPAWSRTISDFSGSDFGTAR